MQYQVFSDRRPYFGVVGVVGSNPAAPIGWETNTDQAFGSFNQLLKVFLVVKKFVNKLMK